MTDDITAVETERDDYTRKDFLAKAGAVAAGAAGLAALGTRPAAAVSAPTLLRRSKITLQYWRLGNDTPAQMTYWQTLAAQYSKVNPDVTVKVVFVPNYQGSNTLTAAFAGGVGPDVFISSPGDLLRYLNLGLAQPLNTYLTPAQIKDFTPSALQAMTVGGKIYYLRYEMEPVALFYDKKLFADKGLNPPTTWAEMIDTALKLKTPRRAGIVMETTPDAFQNFVFYPWLWQGGGKVVDDAWTRAEIDSPAGVAALQLWGDLINKYKVAPTKTITRTSDILLLAKGFTAMQETGSWTVAEASQLYPTFQYGVVPLPHPAHGRTQSIYGGWGFMASAHSKYPADAAHLAVWLSGGVDKAAAARGAEWVSGVKTDLSPRISVSKDLQAKGFFKKYPLNVFQDEVYPTAQAEPRYTPEIVTAVSKAIQAVQFGGVSGASAAATAAREINAFLKTYKGAR